MVMKLSERLREVALWFKEACYWKKYSEVNQLASEVEALERDHEIVGRVRAEKKRLQSVAEVIVVCRWWKIVHEKLPYRYNGTKYVIQYACTAPAAKSCSYKSQDPRTGGCQICDNVAKIPVGERP